MKHPVILLALAASVSLPAGDTVDVAHTRREK